MPRDEDGFVIETNRSGPPLRLPFPATWETLSCRPTRHKHGTHKQLEWLRSRCREESNFDGIRYYCRLKSGHFGVHRARNANLRVTFEWRLWSDL